MNLRVRVDDVLNTVKMKTRRKYSLFNLVWTIKLAKQKIQTWLKKFPVGKMLWLLDSTYIPQSLVQNTVNKLSTLIKLHIKSHLRLFV